MEALRYGIFRLGQIWTLTDPDGARLGFASREMAIAALELMIAVYRTDCARVVLTLQGHDGQLRTLLNPRHDLLREEKAKGSPWDALFEVQRPAPLQPGGP